MTFFSFFGWCTECNSKFFGVCRVKPLESDPVIIEMKAFDTSQIPHKRKRHFSSNIRKIGKVTLKNEKAKKFKNSKSRKLIDHSDPIPAILSNSGVYQKARHEAIDESLQMHNYPGSTLESLLAMMDALSEIKVISSNLFVVMYWSKEHK